LTFKNAKKLVNVLPKIPQEKLIIETDGPYLTPMPHRGERNKEVRLKPHLQNRMDRSSDETKNI
ncbi:MAG: TatD family hydrolase, partial [Campylobacterota bacterium]|nr:TatD family hydrolase [Campylobacterota bacterium]